MDSGSSHDTKAVRVWLLQGKYGGDNAQVLGLGDQLAAGFGWHCEMRRVRFHPDPEVPRRRIPAAIDFARSDPLDPPWPDVIVSCSRYYGLVGAWLKRCAGGAPVHVHLGRIAAPMPAFDLLAATAQYGLPPAPNFLPLTLPIVRRNPARVEASLAAWRETLTALPRPLHAMLVGGPDSQTPFGATEAEIVLRRAIGQATRNGGALAVAYSKRTPQAVRDIVTGGLARSGIPHFVSGWPAPEANPYPALLALADRFLVTRDSASMIADACVTGKPVELLRLPVAGFVHRWSSRGLGLSLDARRRRRNRAGYPPDRLDRIRDRLVRRCWMRPWDEIRDFLAAIEDAGLVSGLPTDRGRAIQEREVGALAARIAGLVAARRTGAGKRPIRDLSPLLAAAD